MSTSSTPTLSSLGVGSGLDLESIVNALVSARKSTKRQKVDQQKALKEIEVSGLSKMKSTLTSYQDFLKTVKSGEAVNKRSITTDFKTDENPTFKYETTSSLTNSSHDIAVTQLASGAKLRGTADSSNFHTEAGADGKTLYKTNSSGTISFTLGSGDSAKTFSVDIAENSSLDAIIKKVNTADGNPGVSLNYVVGSDGSVNFTLESSLLGDGQDLTLSGDVGIIGMSGDGSENVVQHAQNAKMLVDGVEVSSKSNVFEDQISGLKITASRVSEQKDDGTWITNKLSVTDDKESFTSFAKNFVSKFNEVLSTCDKLYAKNTYTNGKCNYDGGDLAGDSLCNSVKSQLKSGISGFSSSTGKMLFSYGISIDSKGKLTIDDEKLSKAATENYDQFVSVFQELSEDLDKKLDTYTKTRTGVLAQRSDSANSSVADFDKRLNNIDDYLANYESMLRKKYTNLDKMISDMSASMSYIQSIVVDNS
jgi:flagellar hook-associated protein 2